jgi:maltose alpha-D-glucosyltransferase/alpha-amylase/(1->4)-alpha-D-glucan 1-alpha-D-glucosylmutase
MSLPRRIGATYRFQLVPEHGFAAAAARVPYLAELGIETAYVSPVAEAVPGSTHGYDGTDPTALRQELGGERGFATLVAACESHGLGLLVDWVPNHLATWAGGPWWRRLLAEGPESEMAPVFDVDWEAGTGDQRGKVTLPLLDRPLPDALGAGMVRLSGTGDDAVVEVGGAELPVAGGSVRPGEDLVEVLGAQHWRLVDWHDAADRNYRRFFDIDGLVGVRVEDPEVFARTHALLVELAASGRISGIRVDHVDGLREPTAYLRRLADATGLPVVVEKILTGDEELRADWPVTGTTGYEVVDDVGGVLVDPAGLERLVEGGRRDGDRPVEELTVDTRRLMARASFPGEIGRIARRLEVPEEALRETVVRLDRYRTYLAGADGPQDAEAPGDGGTGTRAADDPDDVAAWRAAAGDDPGRQAVADAVVDPARRAAALALQQLTGAVMAKGVEDTAWYRLSGPLAFCEVGGDPGRDRHDAARRLVERAARRAGAGHAGLVPGTTHDTKRSEDVRCRLYALSELPHAFEEGLARLRSFVGLPASGGELAAETRILGQLLLGFLPPLSAGDAEAPDAPGDAPWPGEAELADRLAAAIEKSAREAKRRSSWREPDTAYEGRLEALGAKALAHGAGLVRQAFGSLVDETARLGAVNSLSAVVLRHCMPGIPDCYRGDEGWDLSLVDPDNRRPVDGSRLDETLASLDPALAGDAAAITAVRRYWRDGAVKLLVTARCLHARRLAPGAFSPATGPELAEAEGPAGASVLGLARRDESGWALGVVTRLAGSLAAPDDDLPHGPSYAGTTLVLPGGAPSRWRDALSGRIVVAEAGRLEAQEALALLPVALLVSEPAPEH